MKQDLPKGLFPVGIDAGGTTTRAMFQDPTGAAQELSLPGANVRRHGVELTADRLAEAIRQAVATADRVAWISVCAGVAGAFDPVVQDNLSRAISRRISLPNLLIKIVSDVEIAHAAAFGNDEGLLVIAGTGSAVFGINHDGVRRLVGGWGKALGDEGSGYAIGLHALRAVSEALDTDATTDFVRTVMERLEIHSRGDLIDLVYGYDDRVQLTAPIVLELAERGDSDARAIVSDQIDLLAIKIRQGAEAIPFRKKRIVLWGGLTRHSHYRDELTTRLTDLLPDWQVSAETARTPVEGALLRARTEAEKSAM